MSALLASWMHDIDPWAFRVSGGFGVRWYGLSYIAGFVCAWFILRALARRKRLELDPESVPDVILVIMVGVIVGGRLGYALVYNPSLLTTFTGAFPFWDVLNLTKGGMASHGGMIGLLASAWWIARRQGSHTLHVLDAIVLAAPPGLFFGRLANFVNGELLGRTVAAPGEPGPWWAVRFPQELLERPSEAQLGAIQRMQVEFAAPLPQIVEFVQSGSDRARAAIEPLLFARHPSQLYQAAVEGLIVGAAVWLVWRTPRRPGVVTGVFLIVYGLGRIATETVRLPDVHLGTALGLSRGQWLSAVMILGGAGLLVFIRARARWGRWPEPVAGGVRTAQGQPGDAKRTGGDPEGSPPD